MCTTCNLLVTCSTEELQFRRMRKIKTSTPDYLRSFGCRQRICKTSNAKDRCQNGLSMSRNLTSKDRKISHSVTLTRKNKIVAKSQPYHQFFRALDTFYSSIHIVTERKKQKLQKCSYHEKGYFRRPSAVEAKCRGCKTAWRQNGVGVKCRGCKMPWRKNSVGTRLKSRDFLPVMCKTVQSKRRRFLEVSWRSERRASPNVARSTHLGLA